MKIIAVTQARTGSTRLPGKVLLNVGELTVLQLHLERVLKAKKVDKLIVATTDSDEDAAILAAAGRLGLSCYRGSVHDVLDRFYQSVAKENADYIVRLTSDCPLIDPRLIDAVISFTAANDLDYGTNTLDPTYPDGQDVEVFKFSALKKAWREAKLASEREHVTPYIWNNSSFKGGTLFQSANFNEGFSMGHLRMTVDEARDLEVITHLVKQLGKDKTWLEYANYLETNSDVRSINQAIGRNEGYKKSLNSDQKS